VGPHPTHQGQTVAKSKRYQRHEPEATPLYKIVAEHLETFLREAREKHERALPQYVERELREYLKCGILAHGFLRARCRSCGKELLVALSCKKRGVCPSCNARRMCGTAAHLTDHVVPEAPLRQWVLSVPFELRLLLARDPRALTAVGRIFVQEIFRWQRERAGRAGLRSTQSGAGCFPQRFGGSMNLNVHFHVVVPDGVFTLPEAATRAEFRRLPIPDRMDLETPPSTWRCGSWPGYVAVGFSMTSRASRPWSSPLDQRSMRAWMFVASDEATSGSVIAKHDRIFPASAFVEKE